MKNLTHATLVIHGNITKTGELQIKDGDIEVQSDTCGNCVKGCVGCSPDLSFLLEELNGSGEASNYVTNFLKDGKMNQVSYIQ